MSDRPIAEAAPWLPELQEALPAEAVLTGGDAAAYAVDGVAPLAAVAPDTPEGVAAALAVAARHRLAVCPIGAGRHLGLGTPPLRHDLALSLRRLRGRVEHVPTEMTVTVDAGVRLPELQERLRAGGQWLPLDPPGWTDDPGEGPTIGGLLAAGVSGPRRQGYGGIRDLLLGIRVALADGTLARNGARVVKNVAGYDLGRLFTGSLGTLGVIVEATFRVFPLPEASRIVVIPCAEAREAAEMLDRVSASELLPQFVEILNPAARERIGTRRTWSLALCFEGAAGTVAWQVGRARQTADVAGLRCVDVTPTGRRHASAILGGLALDTPGMVVCRLSVLGSELPPLLGEMDPEWPAWGHALLGSARVCLPADAEAPARVRDLRERVAAVGGFLVVERAPAASKPGLDVWGPARPDFHLMRSVKQRFDPRGILNPGRFVGGL